MDYEGIEQEQPRRGRKPKESGEIVKLNKGGVTISRPESQVENYLELGWQVVE